MRLSVQTTRLMAPRKAVVGHEEDIQSEVTALDGIQHPNVIRFYEYFECAR